MKRITILLLIATVLAGPMLAVPVTSFAQVSVGVSVAVGPPALPVYPQPYAPGPGYIWTPGYWGYAPDGYYWVPGTWVLAPAVGVLWTPGYWGWGGGFYHWHSGYWGPHVGYYGGINYGYGYTGAGYAGGYWKGRAFYYNRAVNNVNAAHIHNTYNQTVINHAGVSRVSYNGGVGGINARPSAEQEAMARERHIAPTATQMRHENLARKNPAQRFSMNHGRPDIVATSRPGKFSGSGVVRVNKTRDSYDYHPVAHPAPIREGVRNEGRVKEARVPEERPMHPEYLNAKQPKQPVAHAPPHAEPGQPKHPPRHEKEDNGRPPPR